MMVAKSRPPPDGGGGSSSGGVDSERKTRKSGAWNPLPVRRVPVFKSSDGVFTDPDGSHSRIQHSPRAGLPQF
ncbi:hypothetical protein L596_014747 [Steinernema carpocapsae]|uniref:Uncharacterized protein n=1 Tax=Steinernema carpocapsae TaxID=34508 RepID=A0A4U5NDR4_STECR|nr:hypothetical protein L596_014747 [Steinernema carpocapsae]